MFSTTQVAEAMIRHEYDCRTRVAHFLKVTAYARLIALQETDETRL